MAKNLAQDFVDLGNFRLGTDTAAELGFDHRESRFDVRPPVIVLQKILFAIHMVPTAILSPIGHRRPARQAQGVRIDLAFV
jgi:hypothetical protein